MDYRSFKAGVSVYFPIFTEGALLFLGDGHTIQGYGEISGSGVEVSFDVEYSMVCKMPKSMLSRLGRTNLGGLGF